MTYKRAKGELASGLGYLAVGSEQALAPVREPDTFAEGAWDKVPKTKGTFDLVLQHTTSHNYHKN
jgi:hypothetical protein